MGRFAVGQSVRRVEDQRLITGHGQYVGDVTLADQAYAYFLRSPVAHGRISKLHLEAAKQAPGVLAVLTVDDLRAHNFGDVPCRALLVQRDGKPTPPTPRPALADGVVRYVGDPIAMIIADTPLAARDAAELIDLDFDELPAVIDLATSENEPSIWPDRPKANIAFDWEDGDGRAVDDWLAKAATVVEVTIVNNRLIPNSMEPRGCNATYDGAHDAYGLAVSCQGVHGIQKIIAGEILGVPREKLRVTCPDVGGGFGMKIFVYPEYVAALLGAKVTGRPVKWIAERTEGMLSDVHGRDHITRAQLAIDENGVFLALRASIRANLGAYLSQFGPFIPTGAGSNMYASVYGFKAVHVETLGVFTNTTPLDAYRGAGRPEAAYLVERVVDAAARQLGISPAEIRRRNFIKPAQMPFTTALGATYDSGEFERLMDRALELAEADGFESRRQKAAADGKLRGLGLGYYIEQCGGGGSTEWAKLQLLPGGGRVRLDVGTQSNGQGHATAYGQLVAEALGIDIADIEFVQGDTAALADGGGTGGSRSLPAGGPAVNLASLDLIEKVKAVAADQLEAAASDIEFTDGRFVIKGTDRSVGLLEVGAQLSEPVTGDADYKGQANTFPNGAHVAEVEIDADTGDVELIRYVVVDDMGVLLNPMLVTGQIHGGVAQGLGQALLEHARFDAFGQPVSGSFMDYAMPRAEHIPELQIEFIEVPCTTNPLGVKGCGEAGAIGAPPAVMNAIQDALAPLGIEQVDMPATPYSLWQLIQSAKLPAAAE